MLQAAQSGAQQGYDAFTLNYLTSGINKAAAASLGTAARLGADPNQLSGILDQRIQGLLKVGSDNHLLNMQNFSRYMGAVEMMGQNKTAEWQSGQNLIKDRLQAANANKQAGLQNMGSAANAFISMDAARRTERLYTVKNPAPTPDATAVGGLTEDEAVNNAINSDRRFNTRRFNAFNG
jgi:hypothetical protein